MADARLYIANIKVGLACKLYSRSGDAYSADEPDGFHELLEAVKRELFIDDDFVIISEGQLEERVPNSRLWRIKKEYINPPITLLSVAHFHRDRADGLRAECVRLHDQAVTLGRKLIDAQNKLSK